MASGRVFDSEDKADRRAEEERKVAPCVAGKLVLLSLFTFCDLRRRKGKVM